jgi:nucleoside-diphosphate-sugar epimerase
MTLHVLTGATGFVGSAILLELLAHGAERVVGVVRPAPGLSPVARLRSVLHPLVPAYGLPASLHRLIDTRVEAVAGDVSAPSCGVEPEPLRGAEFWHCAASLQYQDRHQELIYSTNVAGTRHAVQLAEAMGASRLNMVSTAYVAGSQTGTILEVPGDAERVNNHYERSKLEAERLVEGSAVPSRVLRPGIVIGHATTLHALNYNGMYGFLRGLVKFARALDRAQPGLSTTLQVRMRVDAEGWLGLVPVDHVAQEAVALSALDAPPGIYHLTNPCPPTTVEVLNVCFDVVGMQRPVCVGEGEPLGSIDLKLQAGTDFYKSYLVRPKQFDRTHTDRVLGARAAPRVLLDAPSLERFCRWYMDMLDAETAALPVAR